MPVLLTIAALCATVPSPTELWAAAVDQAHRRAERAPPVRDRALDAVMNEVARVEEPIDVRAYVKDAGVVDGLVVPALIEGLAQPETQRDFTAFVRDTIVPQGVTHYGLGYAADRIAVAFVRRILEVEALPRPTAESRVARLAGRLAPGYSDPEVLIARPDGRIDAVEPTLDGRDLSVFVPFFAGSGRYTLEVIAKGPRGSEVALLTDIEMGTEPLGLRTVRLLPPPEDERSVEVLEERLLALINAARRRLDLDPLVRWERLDRVARRHSEAMAAAGLVAHRLPRQPDAATRLARAGISTSRFYENVAMGRRVEQAHRELWGSPSHRRALISPLVTHLGLGVVSAESPGGRVIYVTELLIAR